MVSATVETLPLYRPRDPRASGLLRKYGEQGMISAICIGLGLILLIVVACFAWRFASKRHSIPCPVWLRWLVEVDNPLAKNWLAGEAIRNHLTSTGWIEKKLLMPEQVSAK
jgi:hypothetical protein